MCPISVPVTRGQWAPRRTHLCSLAGGPLIERWDGESWTAVPSPTKVMDANGNWIPIVYLTDVSAVSARNVWATGYASTGQVGPFSGLTEHWDGSSWSVVNISRDVTEFPGSHQGVQFH